MTRQRVIFVDDEPNLLAGLRRMLRAKSADWDMHFAPGGPEALAMMAEQEFDVVISDMRMPSMDGAQLLAAVRADHPRTARIVLSGHADRDMIIASVGPTQQYLAKPCEVELLVSVVERVLALRELIGDPRLQELLGGVDSLPKPPQVHREMMALATDPDCALADIVVVIEKDLTTSAEVLRLVNSAFFGLPTRVDTVGRAVCLLGLETIQALAVSGAVFRAESSLPPGLDPLAMSMRGLHVGTLCRLFANTDGWPRQAAGDAFLAGMLHEIALPVLATNQPEAWQQIIAADARDPVHLDALEVDSFGCSVTQASAYLLGTWGFSESVVEAVAAQPAACGAAGTPPLADLLAVARRRALSAEAAIETVEGGYLTAERLARWDTAGQRAG
jgi:HD-like signal output (HDOD) protein